MPSDRLLFLTHTGDRPYKPETLGNWFRDQCTAAGVPGSAHGLRKASATRLADNEATPDEIRGFLGHKTNKQGSTYTDKADRGRLADNALAKVSNLSDKLDKKGGKIHG
ncbi:tyrosine-type recombinase/integrase [Albidovulum sediminicola]|uniref:Tyrosine-type recombinase/integrase n=1 Tax=Albidovulum sediminicola TaxID=2984331 RepID=A0ABT2Z0A9_9RHOB|nr:tyrosine-type recombinase/integrase [Defluviimonas sp. WL0075]MCV2864566.1 tyrosine-type recombinase/integrase [Defluviimonas sp. WL0075]